VLSAVARQVVPALRRKDGRLWWIVDDTGHAKKGTHSVGVARQYCGRLGKTDNRQVAVSLSLANPRGSLPLAYRLYLPREWTDERKRRERAGVPRGLGFQPKGEIARRQIETALSQGLPRAVVLADAAYGDEAAFRDWLTARPLDYALAVRAATAVWWDTRQPARSRRGRRGRPRTRLRRSPRHQPICVLEVATALPPTPWRTVAWREGSAAPLSSRFARARVVADRVAGARGEARPLLVVDTAGRPLVQRTGPSGQGTLDDRARLPGA
jgi:SRSO17 transposase